MNNNSSVSAVWLYENKRILRAGFVLMLLGVLLWVGVYGAGGSSAVAPDLMPKDSAEPPKPVKQKRELPVPMLSSILASEDGSISIKWDKVEAADSYEIVRMEKGAGDFEKIADTSECSYNDAGLKPGAVYAYKVKAVARDGESTYCPEWEKTARKMPERIAYVGDSVMSGFAVYGVLSDPRETSFAQTSRRMATINQEDMPQILAYQPDRVYMMVGTNDCVGGKTDEEISAMLIDYYDMVDKLHQANPAIEIIIMGIGPTRSDTVDNATVIRFNNQLQMLVGQREFVYYYDTGKTLRDAEGMLKSEYAAQDGIHWTKAAYETVYADLLNYVRML